MGMTQEQKGDYLDKILMAWIKMDYNNLPDWMVDQVDVALDRSKKYSENSKSRWQKQKDLAVSNAIGMQTDAIALQIDAIGMQTQYIEREKDRKIDRKKLGFPTLTEAIEFSKEKNMTLVDVESWHQARTIGEWTKANGEKVKNWKLDLNNANRFGTFAKKEAPTMKPSYPIFKPKPMDYLND
jgi:hypothetical protein